MTGENETVEPIPCKDSAVGETCPGGTETANGTAVYQDGHPIVVEQGPPWLAELLYAPPEWLVWTTYLLIAVALLALGVGIWRAEIEDYEAFVGEVAEELFVVGCVAGGSVALTYLAALPYWIDVLAGCTLGYCVSQAILVGLPRVLPGDPAVPSGSKD